MRSDKLARNYRAAVSLAAALIWIKSDLINTSLGDPRTLILDEPVNGLDPRACSGSASSCVPWPPKDEPSSSPRT